MIIDTNIFLEVILEQEKSEECKIFLREILEGNKRAFISTFSIDSIVLAMMRNNINCEKIEIFLKSLYKYKGLGFYQIKINDRINVFLFMNKYKLDYDDALVAQTAIATGSKEIVSFDKHFDKVKEIRRIEP